MRRAPQIQIPFEAWPEEDRIRWNAAFKAGDPFDECGPAAHLAERTRQDLYYRYGCFLGFVTTEHPYLLALAPADRLSPSLISQYVTVRRQSCSERTVASDLRKLRAALQLVCPTSNWSWLLEIAKRIEAQAPPKPERHHLVTSDRLYALGMELMDRALISSECLSGPSKAQALEYRDGLMIALLALIPLRRRTLAALRIGKQVVKSGQLWALEIPAEDTKNSAPARLPSFAGIIGTHRCVFIEFPLPYLQHGYARRLMGVRSGPSNGSRIDLRRGSEAHPKGVRFRRQSASFPPCSRNSVVN